MVPYTSRLSQHQTYFFVIDNDDLINDSQYGRMEVCTQTHPVQYLLPSTILTALELLVLSNINKSFRINLFFYHTHIHIKSRD